MPRLLFILLLLGVLPSACVDNRLDANLSEDEMRTVLKEMYMAEQDLVLRVPQADVRNKLAAERYDSILSRHNLSRQQFLTNYEAYQYHPKVFKRIHTQMLEEINLAVTQLEDTLRKTRRLDEARRQSDRSLQQLREKIKATDPNTEAAAQ